MLKLLGKGKSGFSWLAETEGGYAVCKIMHDEKVSYYNFSGSKLAAELKSYEILNQLSLPMPRLLFSDESKNLLVKEYIEGKTGSELIAAGKADDHIIAQLCGMYQRVRNAGLNIDYFPSNFVVRKRILYYIDYECNEFDIRWGLENWGLYYWVNENGMKLFNERGDASGINIPGTGNPVKTGSEKKVSNIISKYLV